MWSVNPFPDTIGDTTRSIQEGFRIPVFYSVFINNPYLDDTIYKQDIESGWEDDRGQRVGYIRKLFANLNTAATGIYLIEHGGKIRWMI